MSDAQANPIECPDGETLKAVLRGTCPESRMGEIEDHLEKCGTCRQRLVGGVDLEALGGDLGSDDGEDQHPEIEKLAGILKTHGRFVLDDDGAEAAKAYEFMEPLPDLSSVGSLGGYEVLGEIARGGMGVVLKAFDPHLKRTVAIKVLAPALAGNPEARARFMREARSIAAIEHDNILPIHVVEPADPLPFIVVPFVDGPSLQEWLRDQGPLDNQQLLWVARKLAEGLGKAHEAGIVHRDLKPANILLDSKFERLWIADFGLAHVSGEPSITRTACLSGTPQFMAPEQIRGESVDHRSDLYALGATLYTVATGRTPFPDEPVAATLHKVVNVMPETPGKLNEDLDPRIERVIRSLMAKEPADRIQSAGKVIELLEGSGETSEEAGKARRKMLLGAGLVVMVCLLFGWMYFKDGKVDERGREEGQGSRLAALIRKAGDGEVIELDQNMTLTGAVDLEARSLIIRAAKDTRPVLTVELSGQAAISTRGRLWLEGLTIRLKRGDALSGPPLLSADGGRLVINNCRIETGWDEEQAPDFATLFFAKNAPGVEIRNCEIKAPGHTLIDSVSTSGEGNRRIQMENNLFILQRCLSFTDMEVSQVTVDFRRNIFLVENFLEGHPDHGELKLELFSRENVFVIDQALMHFPAPAISSRFSWEGIQNVYAIGRWFAHGYYRLEGRYSELTDFVIWSNHTNEKRSRTAPAVSREELLEFARSEVEEEKLVDWLDNKALVLNGEPDAGFAFEFLGPAGLEDWTQTEEGKAWRANVALGARGAHR